jgi:DNA-binding LacI/PurR family transcriptional regulator
VTKGWDERRAAPTLEAVAARAAVSRATASRVLRGAPNVSERARTAVQAAVQELSYTPNHVARSLVTGRTDTVAFYVDESEDRMFSDPFFLGVLRSAQLEIARAGLQLLFSTASRPEDHRLFLNYAAGRHVDGVLLLSLHGRDALPQQLEGLGVPTVLAGRPLAGGDGLHYVDANNAGGAALATGYLLDSGRSTVATVTGPQDMSVGRDRLAGYLDTLEDRGLPERPELVAEGEFTIASGMDATRRLLEAEPGIDAVFAASDLIALGAIRAIEASGRRVPADVAVVGFDDIGDAEKATPSLTTVRQPIAEIGRAMADRLVRRIAGEDPPRVTILPTTLVRRQTA